MTQRFQGMGQNYFGQALNMGSAFQQQGQALMNQGQQMSQQMAGQVPSPQQQWQQLMSMGHNNSKVHNFRVKGMPSKNKANG